MLPAGRIGDLNRQRACQVAAALALQRPLWPPGTRHGYHLFSLGWYESESLRRVDPAHRSLGRYFAEEIAAPLGIEFHIGLPAGFDLDRRATIHGRGQFEALMHLGELPRKFVLGMMNPKSVTRRAIGNPRELLVDVGLNRPDVLAVEIPAGNGIGEPRGVAAAYSAPVTGGLGLTSRTLDALARPAEPPSGGLFDVVMRVPGAVYSLGYLKPAPWYPFGGSANAAFGTPGNCGAFAFADPGTRIGYCYAPNRLGFALFDDPREVAIRDALYRDVLWCSAFPPGCWPTWRTTSSSTARTAAIQTATPRRSTARSGDGTPNRVAADSSWPTPVTYWKCGTSAPARSGP